MRKKRSTSKEPKLGSMMVSIDREAVFCLGSGKKQRGGVSRIKRRRISSSGRGMFYGGKMVNCLALVYVGSFIVTCVSFCSFLLQSLSMMVTSSYLLEFLERICPPV